MKNLNWAVVHLSAWYMADVYLQDMFLENWESRVEGNVRTFWRKIRDL